jgi:hypothetical protein
MRLAPLRRVEDDHAKAPAEGTTLIWLAFLPIGFSVVEIDTSGDGGGGLTGLTAAGSNFIDMEISLPTLNLSAIPADLRNTTVL